MIDWKKMNVCDSCDVTSSERNSVTTYTATFERTNKKITLCRKCLEELISATKRVLETED